MTPIALLAGALLGVLSRIEEATGGLSLGISAFAAVAGSPLRWLASSP